MWKSEIIFFSKWIISNSLKNPFKTLFSLSLFPFSLCTVICKLVQYFYVIPQKYDSLYPSHVFWETFWTISKTSKYEDLKIIFRSLHWSWLPSIISCNRFQVNFFCNAKNVNSHGIMKNKKINRALSFLWHILRGLSQTTSKHFGS